MALLILALLTTIFLMSSLLLLLVSFFFFNDTATTEIYTLSLHDALPISPRLPLARPPTPTSTARHPRAARRLPSTTLQRAAGDRGVFPIRRRDRSRAPPHPRDRKSTRLNSSHLVISYAVFCLKKKKNKLQ